MTTATRRHTVWVRAESVDYPLEPTDVHAHDWGLTLLMPGGLEKRHLPWCRVVSWVEEIVAMRPAKDPS